jgi:pyruvate,water dikinase
VSEQLQPLPVPDNFAFEWDSPEEAMRFWTVDLMHWPRGISRLSGTLDMQPFGRGMATASQTLSMPFTRMDFKVIHGYVYASPAPYSLDPGKMEKRMGDMQARMMEHIPGLYDRWLNEYEPEVRAINDETLRGDYSKLGDGDLADLIEGLAAKREREGELHFLAVFPAMASVMVYEDVYTQLFGEPSGGDHLQLLQGFENKSYQANTELWRLAMEARKRPAVIEIVNEVAPSEAHTALGQSEEGRAFRGAMDEFLDIYGWRGSDLDIAAPTWNEDPTTAYKLLREFAARDDYDPEAEQRSLVAAREAREKLLFDELSGASEQVGMFKAVLTGAQQYLPIQEDHNFYIDQQGVAVERVPALEAGRRLQQSGRVAHPHDCFFLELDELLDALRGGKGDLHGLVAERRREQDENRAIAPPPAVGTPPPEDAEENPMLTKFFGGPPEENTDPRIINGHGASVGTFTGTARVVMTLDEGDRLRNGEVLICPATMPPWTPLFGIASAVVTDHGGVLSHTAIVAREYRIPAVVGTKVATSLIKDGQKVTVDGGAGTVRLEGD